MGFWIIIEYATRIAPVVFKFIKNLKKAISGKRKKKK